MAMTSDNMNQGRTAFSAALQHTMHQIHEQISSTMSWRCGRLQEVTRKLQALELAIRMQLYKDK